jgi:hypothetical protein
LITRSYCAFVSRGTCDVIAMPRVSQNVTLPLAPPVMTTPVLPPVPLMTPEPALPLLTPEPALPLPGLLPVPEDDDPPEPLGMSLTFPTHPPRTPAAAKTTTIQRFMTLTSKGLGWIGAFCEALKIASL